jgi:cobalamin biosynthesis Co2+ chelatase CbiK
MHGTEYDNVVTGVNKNAKKFSKIVIAKPLCSTDKDKETVLKAIYEDAAKTSGMEVANAPTQTETAFVFMGHGTSHSNQVLYTQMQAKADKLGYKNCFIGTVEGKPASTSLESTIAKVKDAGYKKVVLRPLMIAAGDHANNDMAGDWGDAFTEAGFEVTSQIKGLGQLEAVQDLIVAHTKEAVAKLNKSAATIKSVKAGKKSATVKLNAAAVESVAGTKAYPTKYTVRYSTKKNMKGAKKVTTTKTTVKINKLKAKKTYYFQVSAQSATVKNGKFSASKKAKIK